MRGRDKKPMEKKRKPMMLMRPRHFSSTISVDRTRALVPRVALPSPQMKRRVEYMYRLGENDDRKEVSDIVMHVRMSMFFLPSLESARVEKRMPPRRQPRKKEEAGRPEVKGEQWRDQSEMMEEWAGPSQAHESAGSPHGEEKEEEEVHGELVQCHEGVESVKMLMNVC